MRGKNIPLRVREIIAEEYLRNKNRPIKLVRYESIRKIKALGWQYKPGWPGLSAVQKQITEIKQKEKKEPPDPEDKPWHLLALTKTDITPEALPAVMRAWAQSIKDQGLFTIRQARWISRLYYIFKDINNGDQLIRQAYAMALMERVRKYLKKQPEKPDDMWGDWQQDAYIYELVTGDTEITKLVAKQISD